MTGVSTTRLLNVTAVDDSAVPDRAYRFGGTQQQHFYNNEVGMVRIS
jgi:hypothetical protein